MRNKSVLRIRKFGICAALHTSHLMYRQINIFVRCMHFPPPKSFLSLRVHSQYQEKYFSTQKHFGNRTILHTQALLRNRHKLTKTPILCKAQRYFSLLTFKLSPTPVFPPLGSSKFQPVVSCHRAAYSPSPSTTTTTSQEIASLA